MRLLSDELHERYRSVFRGRDPKGGNPVDVEELYRANTITREQHRRLMDERAIEESRRKAAYMRRMRDDRMAEEWEASHAVPRG